MLKARSLTARLIECHSAQVSGVRFSPEHEILWAGTESGNVYSLQFPSLERYASVRCDSASVRCDITAPLPTVNQEAEPARAVCSAHNGGVRDMAALGDGLASVSAGMLRYHAVGGLPQATVPAPEAKHQCSCLA